MKITAKTEFVIFKMGTRIKKARLRRNIMAETENELDSKQILSVIERYNNTLDLLDAYDHQTLKRPKGNQATHALTYEE